jgi:hypothetical protein
MADSEGEQMEDATGLAKKKKLSCWIVVVERKNRPYEGEEADNDRHRPPAVIRPVARIVAIFWVIPGYNNLFFGVWIICMDRSG